MDKEPSNSQKALQKIREMIFSGHLPAGSDHLETELAERLEMSRTPIREAILMLEGQGLLELRPRKGVRILPLSVTDMAEIYDVLTELESLAAEKAASAGHGPEQLAGLTDAIEAMDQAIEDRDLNAWARADDLFHQELVRLGGNSRIVAIVDMMSDQVRRARAMTLTLRPLPTQSNNDHRDVLNAIIAGDGRAARQTHRNHRRDAKAILIEILNRHQFRFI